jgi:hypothetical protein
MFRYIDVGFGSSKTAIVSYQILNSNKIKILHAKENKCPQQDERIAIAADHI